MSPIATEEEQVLVAGLYEWQSPATMIQRVETLGELLGDHAMQRRGRAFREAFVAGRFARNTGQEAVRLLVENPSGATPDFAVRRGEVVKQYETTEADVPGRRRQLEYREPRPEGIIPMQFTSLTTMVDHIRTITARKAAKRYEDCTGLVVLLNPPMFSFEPKLRMAQLLEATAPAAETFSEVWIVRDRGALLWSSGIPAAQLPDDF